MLLEYLYKEPMLGIVFLLAIIISLTIHEFSHALASYSQGDTTAKDLGRLTLNPLAHLDIFGTITLLIAGFGWGKPVPYNVHNLKNKRFGQLIVALAGPFSNLVVFIIFGLIYRFLFFYTTLDPDFNLLMIFILLTSFISFNLMLFNILPIPPLDGSQILDFLVPDRFFSLKRAIFQQGPMILLFLVMADVLFNIPIFSFMNKLTEVIFIRLFAS